jgi:putative acetyltransferase
MMNVSAQHLDNNVGLIVRNEILFSRMTVDTAQGPIAAVSLARRSAGASRPRRWKRAGSPWSGSTRERGERIVIVLGHARYYPRFGFSSEKARNLASPFPPESFMALELCEGALEGVHGAVRYPAAFGL